MIGTEDHRLVEPGPETLHVVSKTQATQGVQGVIQETIATHLVPWEGRPVHEKDSVAAVGEMDGGGTSPRPGPHHNDIPELVGQL